MEIRVKKFQELTPNELFEIYKLRCEVFIVEQNCVYQDVDNLDLISYHISFYDGKELVAYCRVIPQTPGQEDVVLGRVISRRRRIGLGTKLVLKGIEVAEEKLQATKIAIHAQAYARDLYGKAGFRAVGEEFLEDGIPHVGMIWEKNSQ